MMSASNTTNSHSSSLPKQEYDPSHLENKLTYQWIEKPQEATFLRRLNRFACQVELEDRPIKVYLPNSGRLEDLLVPGSKVILEKRRESGKTDHDMLLVQSKGFPKNKPIWVGLDSRQPPALLRWVIESGQLDVFGEFQQIKNEPPSISGRFDLEIKGNNCTHIIETKSVNLLDASGIARFPDAPTARGRKHLHALIDLQSRAIQTWVVFIVLRQDAIAFSPFTERDPLFSEALQEAKSAGVRILALKYRAGIQISYNAELEIVLPGNAFPGFWSFTHPLEETSSGL